jgi:hypothetical protein
MIIRFPCDFTALDVFIYSRATGQEVLFRDVVDVFGDTSLVKDITTTALPDGDYDIELIGPPLTRFCCRVENQVATIADFWPQLDMLKAMQTGKAYNWTNQANEVLRVAIEEAIQ